MYCVLLRSYPVIAHARTSAKYVYKSSTLSIISFMEVLVYAMGLGPSSANFMELWHCYHDFSVRTFYSQIFLDSLTAQVLQDIKLENYRMVIEILKTGSSTLFSASKINRFVLQDV